MTFSKIFIKIFQNFYFYIFKKYKIFYIQRIQKLDRCMYLVVGTKTGGWENEWWKIAIS